MLQGHQWTAWWHTATLLAKLQDVFRVHTTETMRQYTSPAEYHPLDRAQREGSVDEEALAQAKTRATIDALVGALLPKKDQRMVSGGVRTTIKAVAADGSAAR